MESPSDNRRKALHIALICLAVAAAYFNATANGFVWDDLYFVQKNYLVTGWEHLYEIFTTNYWACRGQSYGLYRPLTIFSFLVEHTIAGFNPLIYHIDNILLHAACTVAAYFLLGRVFRNYVPALFAALFFAVHPVHVESVSWVSGRAELLAALFVFLSIYAHITRKPGRAWSPMSVVYFMLGLLSKESALVAPILIALYWLMFERQGGIRDSLRSLVRLSIPYAVSFAIYLPVRFHAIPSSVTPKGFLRDITLYERVLVMCKAFTHYIRLAFLPFDLLSHYEYPIPKSFFSFEVVFPLAVLLGLIVFWRRICGSSRPAAYAGALFFITLLPVSNIVLSDILMTDRAMYMPSLAPCMLLGMAFGKAWAYRPGGADAKNAKYLVSAAALVALVSLSSYTIERNPFWKNQEGFDRSFMELFKRRIERYPDYYFNYGIYALEMSRKEGANQDEVELYANEAIRLAPEDYLGYLALASSYYSREMYDKSLEYATEAVSLRPDDHGSFNLMGMSYMKLGDPESAQQCFEKALELAPSNPEALANMGWVLTERGDWQGALEKYEAALRFNPANSDTLKLVGIALGACGRYAEAVEKLSEALELKPGNAETMYYLGAAYYGLGDLEQASLELREALKLRPGYPEAVSLLGTVDARRASQPPVGTRE